MEQTGVPSQGLLLPVTVDLSAEQALAAESALDILKRMGFRLEFSGKGTLVISAIPSVMQMAEVKPAILEITDEISNSPDTQDKLKLQEKVLIATACHSSVKAGEQLSDPEVANLLKDLFATGPPYVCPHGRPIIVRMNRLELEQKFQRK